MEEPHWVGCFSMELCWVFEANEPPGVGAVSMELPGEWAAEAKEPWRFTRQGPQRWRSDAEQQTWS